MPVDDPKRIPNIAGNGPEGRGYTDTKVRSAARNFHTVERTKKTARKILQFFSSFSSAHWRKVGDSNPRYR